MCGNGVGFLLSFGTVMFALLLCRLQEGGVTQVLAIINRALACTCRMVAPRASARYTICTFNVVNTYVINVR